MAIVTISLNEDSRRLASTLIKTKKFSKWINNKVKEELRDEQSILQEIQKHQEQIKILKENLEMIREYNSEKNEEELEEKIILNVDEKDFWVNCIDVLKERGLEYVDGQRNLYNNKFGKSLNRKDFLKKYEIIKNNVDF